MKKVEMTEFQDSLWMLRCKNQKCGKFFDYFGRLRPSTHINCANCGKASRYGVGDFKKHKCSTVALPSG